MAQVLAPLGQQFLVFSLGYLLLISLVFFLHSTEKQPHLETEDQKDGVGNNDDIWEEDSMDVDGDERDHSEEVLGEGSMDVEGVERESSAEVTDTTREGAVEMNVRDMVALVYKDDWYIDIEEVQELGARGTDNYIFQPI